MAQRIDLLGAKWRRTRRVDVRREPHALVAVNESASPKAISLRFPLVTGPGDFTLRLGGRQRAAASVTLVAFVGSTRQPSVPINSWTRFSGAGPARRLMLRLELAPHAAVELEEFWLETSNGHDPFQAVSPGATLLITPRDPVSRGMSEVIRARVDACRRANEVPVVFVATPEQAAVTSYDFEGTQVCRGNHLELVRLLDRHRFVRLERDGLEARVDLALQRSTANRDTELLVWAGGASSSPLRPRARQTRSVADATSRQRGVALTVGVPLFNMERLIGRCLDSMLAGQALDGLEVLVVDDGSTDRSLSAAQRFAARFPSVVKVISKPNGGHGSVLNRVIAEARGRYLRIVDADDWVDSKAFAALLAQLEGETADLVLSDFAQDWADRETLQERTIYAKLTPGRLESFDTLAASEDAGFTEWGPVLATATFKTEVLRRSAFKVDEGISYVDMEYCTLPLAAVDTVRYSGLDVYRYSLGRPNQTVERASFMRKHAEHERVVLRLAEFAEHAGLSAAKRGYVIKRVLGPLIGAHRQILGEWRNDLAALQAFEEKLRAFPRAAAAPNAVTAMPPPRRSFAVRAGKAVLGYVRRRRARGTGWYEEAAIGASRALDWLSARG